MRRFLLIVAAVFVLAPASAAHAQTSAQAITLAIARDYQADGEIDPCAFSTEELQTALDTVGPDTKQYGADFPAAIRAAIAARARGDCGDPAVVPPVTPTATPTPQPTATPTPEPTATTVPMQTVIDDPPVPDANIAFKPPLATSSLDATRIGGPDNDIPTPLFLLGVLGLLVLAGWALVRGGGRVGVTEGRLAPVRHAWREAAWRVGGNWETFRDWVRLGR
jgi:hypothetical protein